MCIVEKARLFSTKHHFGQKRKYGNRDYIYHPSKVVEYLNNLNYSNNVLCAGWCHDLLEDCPAITYNILKREFGPEISRLVWEVTHPIVDRKLSRSERWELYLLHYSNSSILGKQLKLVDRICNLQEYIDFWPEVNNEGCKFLNDVYLNESNDLVETIGIGSNLDKELINLINELDKLCEEDLNG